MVWDAQNICDRIHHMSIMDIATGVEKFLRVLSIFNISLADVEYYILYTIQYNVWEYDLSVYAFTVD